MVEEPRPLPDEHQPDRRDDDLGVKHRNALYAFAGLGALALGVLVAGIGLSIHFGKVRGSAPR